MALTFSVAVVLAITAVCGAFLMLDVVIPNWFVIVARWIPAIVAATVIVAYRQRDVLGWFRLRTPWRRAVIGSLVAVGVLLSTYAIAAAVALAAGVGEPHSASFYLRALAFIAPATLLFSLSTLGEEVAWRGFLHSCLGDTGVWRSSAVISGLWVIFHLPLHGTMVYQGVLPLDAALTSTLTLFALGLLLSATAHRFGSPWPAAFAHALPLSTLNLISLPAGPSAADHWVVAGITFTALVLAAVALAPGRRSAGTSTPAP